MRLLIFVAMLPFLLNDAIAEPHPVGEIRAINGDNILLSVVLVGLDAPEIGNRAKCEGERQLAQRTKNRLLELAKSGKVSIELVRCSCPNNTQGQRAAISGGHAADCLSMV